MFFAEHVEVVQTSVLLKHKMLHVSWGRKGTGLLLGKGMLPAWGLDVTLLYAVFHFPPRPSVPHSDACQYFVDYNGSHAW